MLPTFKVQLLENFFKNQVARLEWSSCRRVSSTCCRNSWSRLVVLAICQNNQSEWNYQRLHLFGLSFRTVLPVFSGKRTFYKEIERAIRRDKISYDFIALKVSDTIEVHTPTNVYSVLCLPFHFWSIFLAFVCSKASSKKLDHWALQAQESTAFQPKLKLSVREKFSKPDLQKLSNMSF